MKGGPVWQVLSCVVLFLISITWPATPAAGLTMRADLTHVDRGRGFTRSELVTRMLSRSRARAASSLYRRCPSFHGHPATAAAAPATSGQAGTEYLIHLAIGSPRPQQVALELDTGSDLIWTQCASCIICFDQPSPRFNPSASTTIRTVPCSDPICAKSIDSLCTIGDHTCFYLDSYVDGTITVGSVVRDTFTFKGTTTSGDVVVPGLSFGCGFYNKGLFGNDSGIAGFGHGSRSLPSQLKVGKFSHCFTSTLDPESKSSPVFLGTPDDLTAHATGKIKSTPMRRNPAIPANNYYYVSLEGITVGDTRLPVSPAAFAINKKDGSGGTIIDSGTAITTFPTAVYELLYKEFVAQVPLPVVANTSEAGGLPLCFAVASAADADKARVPKLVFHLEGADMDLPPENYMALIDGNQLCLMLNGLEGDLTTFIGNFQQQNMHIVYDLDNSKLFFVPAQCDKL